MLHLNSLAVFCGAHVGHSPIYAEAACDFADYLCKQNIKLIYGGSHLGIMGALADAMLAQGGTVVGVVPQFLRDIELVHPGLTELHLVNSMHERKSKMAELADGFVLLPGGMGSLDEFFEVTTWAQLGLHNKPCGIINTAHYFDALITFLDQATQAGFIGKPYRNMVLIADAAEALLQQFRAYQPPLHPRQRNPVNL